MTDIELFRSITETMVETYSAKNSDYGNSFEEQLNEDGLIYLKGKLGDKYSRIKTLIKQPAKVKESILDTLLDLACYSIMGIIWITKNEANQN